MEFSHVIVGGGSAGCVLANRLSARAANRVLLLEAGRDTPPGAVPADIASAYASHAAMNPRYFWPGLRAFLAAPAGNAAAAALYEQARVMGGGSSVNGQVMTRAGAEDYDRWAELGAAGWGWESVLPCFRRVERDLDFAGPLHGDSGPVPVRRFARAEWDRFSDAAAACLEAEGHRYLPDLNAACVEGFAAVPVNNLDGRRVSAAAAYLDPATRARANLFIRAGARVRRVLFEGARAVGVEIDGGADGAGAPEPVRAAETILSAGAIHSPALLMRSGVGPAGHLAGLGIAVIADLPEVGRNLQEHPAIHVSAYLARAGRMHRGLLRHNYLYLRYASGVAGTRPPDMLLNFACRSAWHAVGRRLATIQAYILQPFSRGSVRLAGPGPDTPPEVRFNHLDDERDARRLMEALRRLAAIFRSPPVTAVASAPFATVFSDKVRRAGRVTLRNRAAMAGLAALLDLAGPLRGAVLGRFVSGAPPLAALEADEALLAEHVRRSVTGVWHPAGTCRLGAADDPAAVLDPAARVRGLGGLRVADASVMPEIPRCNTNLPAMMIGERVAELVLAGR